MDELVSEWHLHIPPCYCGLTIINVMNVKRMIKLLQIRKEETELVETG
jgi:hypothetical protein